MKFYAVRKGRNPGIYLTWPDCQQQVKNFSCAQFKSFPSYEEALAWMQQGGAPAANAPSRQGSRQEFNLDAHLSLSCTQHAGGTGAQPSHACPPPPPSDFLHPINQALAAGMGVHPWPGFNSEQTTHLVGNPEPSILCSRAIIVIESSCYDKLNSIILTVDAMFSAHTPLPCLLR